MPIQPAILSKKKIAEAYALLQSGDTAAAAAGFLMAWNLSQGDLKTLKVCGDALVEMGERDQAFVLLDDAIKRHGQTEEVSLVMGHLAVRMQLHDIAEKAFQAAIGCNPSEPSHYVNLTQAMAKNGRDEDAIALLQEIIPVFPDHAMLWNSVGVILKQYQNKHMAARTFFEQAHVLAPEDVSIIVNMAQGQEAEISIGLLKKAITLEPDNSAAHLALAFDYIKEGRLEDAWPHYEHRLDWNSPEIKAPRFNTKARRWKGQSLQDKSILVMAEQGIGDEVLFAMNMPRLVEEAGTVIISCDPRLVSVYERSFPSAHVIAYEDRFSEGFRFRHFPAVEQRQLPIKGRVDYAVPLATVASQYWSTLQDLPMFDGGYIKPDPARVTEWAERLKAHAGKKLVGLSWRSGHMDGPRQFGYFGTDGLKGLRAFDDVIFVCLQYGAEPAEIDIIRNEIGLDLLTFDDIDLKADIESNLAIMAHLDLVIGPNIATQMFALATGAETAIIAWGRPWWADPDPETRRLKHNPNCRLYVHDGCGWPFLIDQLVADYQSKPSKT